MSLAAVVGFGLAMVPLCLTPGVSFGLVTQRVVARGRRAGVQVAVGTACGLVTHAALAAAGLAALVMRSSEAFVAVKLAGAAYLLWLGASLLIRAHRSARTPTTVSERRLPWSVSNSVLQGYLGNVLNPKAAAVYLTLAPQFLTRDEPVVPQLALLVAAHVIVSTSWLLIWTNLVYATRAVFMRPRARRMLDRVTGSVMVGLGIRTAVAGRA